MKDLGAQRATNEYVANQLYKSFGVSVPETKVEEVKSETKSAEKVETKTQSNAEFLADLHLDDDESAPF